MHVSGFYNILKFSEIYDYTSTNAEKALVEPTNLVEIQILIKFFNKIKSEVEEKESEFPKLKEYFTVLDKYEITISSGMREKIDGLAKNWKWYLGKLKDAEEMIDVSKDQFKLTLMEETKEFKKEAQKLLDQFGENAPFTPAL